MCLKSLGRVCGWGDRMRERERERMIESETERMK